MSKAARPEIEVGLAEAEAGAASEIAREQFAHGVLESYHLDGLEDRERRMASMMMRLDEESRPVRMWTRVRWRVLSGVAAAIALTSLVILGMPTETSATAVVQASLAASKKAGDRRYEIKARLPRDDEADSKELGTLDVRDSEHLLMQVLSPFGDRVVLGRNGEATWAIRPDGTVDNYPPRQAWPRWFDFGSSTVLLVPVEDLVGSLEKSYTLRRREAEISPSGKGPKCERIVGEHKMGPGRGPDPARVELWIDPQSHVVRRMELHWPPRPRPGPGQGPGPRGGEGGEDRPLGPEGRPQDGPRPRDGGPDGRRPPHPPPPDRARGEEDRERRPPPRPDGFGPPDGGPRGRPPHPPPEFLGGPPDFDAGRRPPPPRLLVFELVDGATFGQGWFESAAHVK